MEKFETPSDSPPVIVIDPDDQPMWSSTRTVAPTPSSAIIQLPISNNFRIKGTHIQMIRDIQFDGRIQSDPHRHIANFLEISNLFQYVENQEVAVMLSTFPFSLCEEAKIWLNELNEGTITSWNEMREAFISRYFSLAKFKRLLNDIHNFHQLGNETLVEAWIHLKEMFRIYYGHGLTKGTIVHIFYHGLDGPTQGILNVGGIFLYNTPNEAFQILEDKVLLKLDFSGEFQISPKNVVSAGGSNIDSYHTMLMEKFEDLATKIDSEFLIIRKELKETRDGRRDNHALQIYMKDDTPMCEPHEANYVQRYQGGYHDHEPINSYSYPNHNPNCHYPYPRNQMPRPSRYFEFTKTSMEEMMKEWMASQMKANERMKNQVVELENQVNQELRNHQAIIQNLERQFEFLLPTKTLPSATNTKPRHEIEMDDPDITMKEYIQFEAEKAHFENEFLAIVYEDALTSEPEDSSEPTLVDTAYPTSMDTTY
ncbi:reverse transcriptase domain-containing protein [Tanacetum coccineum]